MALLEPAHEFAYQAVGLLLGRLIIGFDLSVFKSYDHDPPGDYTARAAQATKPATKPARHFERQIRVESKLTGETRQSRLCSVKPLLEDFQSCLNFAHASSLLPLACVIVSQQKAQVNREREWD
jgi:hypothetical protein